MTVAGPVSKPSIRWPLGNEALHLGEEDELADPVEQEKGVECRLDDR
jgi:hypothetical protein